MVGEVVGKYRILERLSEGGMGELYRASAAGPGGFEREVALKVIQPNVQGEAEFRRMFIEEAKIASRMNHGNVVHLYAFETHEDLLFFCMELVQGKDVVAIMRRARVERGGRPGVPYVVRIVQQVAEGLEYAHRLQVDGQPLELVHRDVSPNNILVSFDGAVKITDFGIARVRRDVPLTRSGVIKGKLGYMSPEQASAGAVDRRSDIFSLGIVAWEMLTGQRLFVGSTDEDRLRALLGKKVEPPSKWNRSVPADLDAAVLRALERHPWARFQSAREFAKALTEVAVRHGLLVDAVQLGRELRRLFPTEVPSTAMDLAGLTAPEFLPPPAPAEAAGPTPAGAPTIEAPRAPPAPPPDEAPTIHESPTLQEWAPGRSEVPTFLRPGRKPKLGLLVLPVGLLLAAGGVGVWKKVGASPPRQPSPSLREPPDLPPTPVPRQPAPSLREPPDLPPIPTPAVAEREAQGSRPTRRAAPGRKPGTLAVVGLHPWAEVFVDGVSRGWSPSPAIALSAGKHRVTLVNAEEHLRRSFAVDVPAAGRVVLQGELKTLRPERSLSDSSSEE